MIACNKLRGLAVLGTVLLVLPADLLEARNKKGDKLVAMGREAEAEKDYDRALEFFEQALRLDQQDPGYQLNVRRMKFTAGQAHVDAGVKLKNSGELEKAQVEFQKA